METLKIAVLAVQPSQAIGKKYLSGLRIISLDVRDALLAVLAVHPGPFAWTGKADRGLYVLCVRRGVRVSSIKSSPGTVHRLKSALPEGFLHPVSRQTRHGYGYQGMPCRLSEFAETDA